VQTPRHHALALRTIARKGKAVDTRWADIKLGDESMGPLELADGEAHRRGHSPVGLEDLLLGVLASGKGAAFEALASQGLGLDSCHRLFEVGETGARAG